MFEGSSYNASDPNNINVQLNNVQIQNISLNGGGSDLIFVTPYGSTSQNGSFDIQSIHSTDSLTLSIDENGNVTY